GADGSVGCTKRACATSVWLSMQPVQCHGNPWEKVTPKGDGTAPAYPIAELLTIDNFFEDQSIDLLELGLVDPTVPLPTCAACTCIRGDRLVVRARQADAAALQTLYGFAPLDQNQQVPWLNALPKQCNTNPWQPAPGDPKQE